MKLAVHHLRNAGVVILATLLFFFLLGGSQAVNSVEHDQYNSALRQLQSSDANLNENVLQVRVGLLIQYDALIAQVDSLKLLTERLNASPGYLSMSDHDMLRETLSEYSSFVTQKEELVHRFASENAIYRNSVAYFPTLMREIQANARAADVDQASFALLAEFIQNVLVYETSGGDDLVNVILDNIDLVQTTFDEIGAPPIVTDELEVATRHAEVIVEKKPVIDNLLAEIIAVPTLERGESLIRTYEAAYDRALIAQRTFQFWLTGYAISLVAIIAAVIIVRLRTASLSEARAKQRFESIFNNASEGIFQQTDTGKIVTANPALARILGFDDPDQVRREVKDVADLHVNQELYGAFRQKILDEGSVSNYEAEIYRRDGSVIWVSANVRLVPDENGGETLFEGVAQDITERKFAAQMLQRANDELEARVQERTADLESTLEALQKSEDRFRVLLEHAPVAIVIVDQAGRIVMANRRAEESFGFELGTMSGLGVEDLLPEALQIIHQQHRTNYFEAPTARKMAAGRDLTGRHRNGQDFPVEIALNYIESDQGKLAVSFINDVTDRRRFEQALRRQQEYSAALLDTALGIMNRLDLNDLLRDLIVRAASLLNVRRAELYLVDHKRKELVSQALFTDGRVVQQRGHSQKISEGVSGRVWEMGEPLVITDYARWKYRVQRLVDQHVVEASDTIPEMTVAAVPLKVGHQVVGVLDVVIKEDDRDFSDEDLSVLVQFGDLAALTIDNARLYSTALTAQAEAEAASRAKSTFLANMSHELRTPMNAILGFAQLMERDPDLPQTQRENLSIIERSGEHLLDLINDVLEVSKIEAGQVDLDLENFDLKHLLSNIEVMLSIRAAKKGLDLHITYADGVPQYIRTDESKLRQVLLNLVGNAVKFTETGSVTVDVSFTPETSHLVFKVADTGVGIAKDELPRLFEAFTQTASGRNLREGTGLGIPISQQYIHLMGGTLEVESEVGVGSVFTFTVRVDVVETSVPVRIQMKRVVGIAPGQPTYRILIAEDRWENRMLLVQFLTMVGFDVKEAVNGREALDIMEIWQPHLIFMDMRMPVMDGYEATRRIRSTPQGQGVVIVALTASAFEHERAAILAIGCDDFIRKPFQEATLFSVIEKHIGVEFVYEDIVHQPVPAAPNAAPAETDARTLAGLSADWRDDFQQAAALLDSEEALTLIEQIRPDQPELADHLSELVKEFDFGRLLALLEAADKPTNDAQNETTNTANGDYPA